MHRKGLAKVRAFGSLRRWKTSVNIVNSSAAQHVARTPHVARDTAVRQAGVQMSMSISLAFERVPELVSSLRSCL
jgi:hypothetical protein